MSTCVAALRESLAGADYHCETPVGARTVRARFIGRFEQHEVVWDAELIALAGAEGAQFIDIGAPSERGMPIKIGLQVACIDQPTLQKAIIMVRNYKRLRIGRHDFGSEVNANEKI
ncbi:MAG: hypothetical protein KKA36_09135 [Gammaproteobacteria bacterium]|nr:hypothetical protein [Gammaproteobacteria bacterium]MBU2479240.1 hypothetical protein [Gammaproteobacteria bacterium]